MPDSNGPYDAAIIGGGFCGTLSLIRLVKLYKRYTGGDENIRIAWYDREERAGSVHSESSFEGGSAYRECPDYLEDAFVLTQPARLMSPFEPMPNDRRAYSLPNDGEEKNLEDQEHFARWNGEGLEAYATRRRYRQYLKALVKAYTKPEDLGRIRVERIPERVTKVDGGKGAYQIESLRDEAGAIDEPIEAMVVIAAIGHPPMPHKAGFTGMPGFIGNPDDPESYREVLSELRAIDDKKRDRAIIAGSGNTAVDSIRALERAGFRGTYVVISNSGVRWWPFDPYVKNCEAEGFVPGPAVPLRTDKLTWWIMSQDCQPLGRGCYSVPVQQTWRNLLAAGIKPKHAKEFLEPVLKDRGATMCPVAYEELVRLFEANRLKFVKGSAVFAGEFDSKGKPLDQTLRHDPNGEKPWRWNRPEGETDPEDEVRETVADLLVDATGFKRQLNRRDAPFECADITRDDSRNLFQAREGQGLFVVGPSARPILSSPAGGSCVPDSWFGWGVETFRNEVRVTAERAFERWRLRRAGS